jgi:predicted ABC-type ATPase
MIGGPNGAGKTTLVQREPLRQLLAHVVTLNPDDVTRRLIQQQGYSSFLSTPEDLLQAAFIRAAEEVFADLEARLARCEAVAVESVLSTGKYRPVVDDVLRRGGFFGLIYVALQSAELSQDRVRDRVLQGGHHVPAEKVASRWRRSLDQLPWFVARAHACYLFDNSDANPDNPPRLIAQGRLGVVTMSDPQAIPAVTEALAKVPSYLPT